jgi:hypothetical protein
VALYQSRLKAGWIWINIPALVAPLAITGDSISFRSANLPLQALRYERKYQLSDPDADIEK